MFTKNMWSLFHPACILHLFVCCFSIVNGAVEDGFLESASEVPRACVDVDHGMDPVWLGQLRRFYNPLWSKLERARNAAFLLNKTANELTEKDLEMRACRTGALDGIMTGYGTDREFQREPTHFGGYRATLGDNHAEYRIFLTDNRRFILYTSCWSDGHVSWALETTEPSIDVYLEKRIMRFVVKIGFNPKFAIKESYEDCDLKTKQFSMDLNRAYLSLNRRKRGHTDGV